MQARVLGLVSAIAAIAASPAFAHHSFAMYDREKTLTLSGVVKDFTWAAPHVMIEVLADKDHAPWTIEGNSPTVLARGGWTGSLMKPGDRISLGLHPRKDGVAGGLLADEQQMLLNGRPPKGVLWLKPNGKETER
jgi:hypothetical protein